MCKFCAMSDRLPPPFPASKQKRISAEITSHSSTRFWKKKKKKRDGIKGKNSISQQALLLSEHSRVCALNKKKKAWEI